MTAITHSKTKPPPKRPGNRKTQIILPTRGTDWQRILELAGYPTKVIVIDFETFFDDKYSLRKDDWSTIEYIMDDQFEILGMAGLRSWEPYKPRWYAGEDAVRKQLEGAVSTGAMDEVTVVSQNAVFDMAILAYRYGIYPKYMIDTLGLARHWQSRARNDLRSIAKRENFSLQKGDTSEFKEWTYRKRYKRSKSRKRGLKMPIQLPTITPEMDKKLGDYAKNDVSLEWEVFNSYLLRLSTPSIELLCMQHTLELFTKPVLEVDYAKAEILTRKMTAEIDVVVNTAGYTKDEISGENNFTDLLTTLIEDAGDHPRKYQKFAKNKKGWKYATAKDDPERELLELHSHAPIRELMAAKAAMSSWPNHIKRVGRICSQSRAAGGKLPVPLRYCGAHTGRWSGSEKINLQNLGSRGHELVNEIRELIVAPDGFELVIADAAAIEARVLAWIANQTDVVEMFADNVDMYSRFASELLGYPVRAPRSTDSPPRREKMKWARNSVGKVGYLGCGYGMGAEKAIGYSGGTIDLDMAQQIVKKYRSENAQITQFWRDIEKSFIYTAQHKKPCVMDHNLRFHSTDDCDVIITLPSDRELKYHDVRVKPGDRGPNVSVYNAIERYWGHVWGGHLTENVVQAISRDLLWSAVAYMEDRGHHVPHHVHDELISCVPEGTGESVLQTAIASLTVELPWAKGLPLNAEGLVTKRYGGH